ncbi:MAG: hypothetical protein ILP16_01770, partial [Spirochaetales bacterium]|nr:hypothetical protein [Spirochaetales bacterium]
MNNTVSERRYLHSLGVAETTAKVLSHFKCTDYTRKWNGFDAPTFCGLAHDIAREMSDASLLVFCEIN